MKTWLQIMLGLLLIATMAIGQPTITSFTPASGPVGTSVTITGTNFSAIATNNIVFFGATRASVTTASTTQLTVTVPIGATYESITVLVGGFVVYSAKPFVVTFADGAGIDASAFAPRVNLPVVALPESVFIGDIDGDGKADIATVNSSFSSVSVLRNTSTAGTISYAAKVDFATAGFASSVTIGDIDGDGKPDLVTTNSNNANVSVFRNTSTSGTISFAAKVEFTTGTIPQSVTIRDLDGDGKADLAVSNGFSGSVSIFRNTGIPGTIAFATKIDFSVGTIPYSVSARDLDGDGKAEIVVANDNARVSILRNTSTVGTISFAAKVDIAAGGNPRSVSIGDIDGDGLPDLAVANSSTNTISLLRNTSTSGTISFAAKVDVTSGLGPLSVSLGDIDGNGTIDMVTANSGSNTVSVFGNTSTIGTMSFAAKVDFATNTGPQSAAIGDLDGDGKPDVLAGCGITTVHRNTIKFSQTISFGALATKAFGDVPFALTATSSSALPISYTSSNTAVATVSGNTLAIIGGGSTTITAMQAGNANYAAATNVPQTLTVNKASQTISFSALPAKTFGDPAFTLAAAASSALAVSYSSSNTAVATATGNTVTVVGVGTTTITASQVGNTNYNSATDVLQAFTVVKANQTIAFGPLTAKAFGDAAFALAATASSSLPVSYSSSNTAVATVSGGTVTIVGTGTTTITASQTGNANYNAATNVQQTLTVNKADQSITFGTLANNTVGDAAFALTATASSGLSINYSSSNTSVATISGSTVTVLSIGTTIITASQPGTANYNPATSVQQTLSVKQNQAITFSALPDKMFGDATFVLTATTSSSLIISYSSSNPAVATVAGNTVTIVGAGTTTITASQAGNTSFNAAVNVDQTLTVNKASQTITFASLSDKTFGDAAFVLTATTSSSLALDYSSSNTAVATVTGNMITIVGAGNAIITAAQEGNLNFNAAANVDQTLVVKKVDQTITFATITDKMVSDASFSLSATASSGSAVTLSTTSNKLTLVGSQVTIVSAGRATVTATQSGNTNYNAATSVERSFCIQPAKPTIALSNTNTASPILTSNSSSGNQWYLNGAAISGATNATLSIAQAGIYKVQVQVDDCVSTFSDDQPFIVTAIEPENKQQPEVYPNPASEELIVMLSGFENNRSVVIIVMDLLGREFHHTTGNGGEEVRIDIRDYKAAQYVLLLTQGHIRVTKSFIKSF